MSKGTVTAKGPSIGSYMDRDIPAWIDTDGGNRYTYDRVWDEANGELRQLADDEAVIAPGLIYKKKRT